MPSHLIGYNRGMTFASPVPSFFPPTTPAESYPTPVRPSHDPVRRLAEGLTLACWSTLIMACGTGVMTIVAAQWALGRYGPAQTLRRLRARGPRPYRHRARRFAVATPILLHPQSPPAPPPPAPTPRDTPLPPHEPLARIA